MPDKIQIDLLKEAGRWRAVLDEGTEHEYTSFGDSPMLAVAGLMNSASFSKLLQEKAPSKQPTEFVVATSESLPGIKRGFRYTLISRKGEAWSVEREYEKKPTNTPFGGLATWEPGYLITVKPNHFGKLGWNWSFLRCMNATELENVTPEDAAQCFVVLGDSVAAAMQDQLESAEDLATALGFDNRSDMANSIGQLALESNDVRRAFKEWRRMDSTKTGLMKLLEESSYSEETP